MLPTTISGVAAATVLGLGRALGEAIAVAQMIGDGTGSTLAVRDRRTASPAGSRASSRARTSSTSPSLFYLALILLAISLVTSVAARTIAGRFDVQRALAR